MVFTWSQTIPRIGADLPRQVLCTPADFRVRRAPDLVNTVPRFSGPQSMMAAKRRKGRRDSRCHGALHKIWRINLAQRQISKKKDNNKPAMPIEERTNIALREYQAAFKAQIADNDSSIATR